MGGRYRETEPRGNGQEGGRTDQSAEHTHHKDTGGILEGFDGDYVVLDGARNARSVILYELSAVLIVVVVALSLPGEHGTSKFHDSTDGHGLDQG